MTTSHANDEELQYHIHQEEPVDKAVPKIEKRLVIAGASRWEEGDFPRCEEPSKEQRHRNDGVPNSHDLTCDARRHPGDQV